MKRSDLARNLRGYGFLLPWLIGLALFISYPFFMGLYFSFTDYAPLREPLPVGLDNYRELAGDSLFHRSLGVTMIFAAVAIPLGVLLALSLSLLLHARIRGQSFYRVVFYLPHLVPTVVIALLWMWIFNPEVGLLNMFLGRAMAAMDAWSSLFFHLPTPASGGQAAANQLPGPGAGAGVWTPRPSSALLLLGPLACLLAFTSSATRRFEGNRRLWGPLRALSIVLLGAAVLTVLYGLLHRIAPADMSALRSPGWLAEAGPMPSGLPFAPSWALWGLIIMSLWGVGQMAIIYLAKLQDVPLELYEAAEIDGAGWWRRLWHITLPMISPVILFNIVMAIIGTFQVFTEPYIMTGGGPEDSTRFLAMFIYEQAFQYQRVGYASAVAWVLFLIIVVLTWLAFRLSRRHVFYQGR